MISHLRPHSYDNVPVQDVSQNSTCKIALSVFEIHLSSKKLGTLVLNLIFGKSQNSFWIRCGNRGAGVESCHSLCGSTVRFENILQVLECFTEIWHY